MIVKLTYTLTLTNDVEVVLPDDTVNPRLEAERQIKREKPFLRTAWFEVKSVEKGADDGSVTARTD